MGGRLASVSGRVRTLRANEVTEERDKGWLLGLDPIHKSFTIRVHMHLQTTSELLLCNAAQKPSESRRKRPFWVLRLGDRRKIDNVTRMLCAGLRFDYDSKRQPSHLLVTNFLRRSRAAPSTCRNRTCPTSLGYLVLEACGAAPDLPRIARSFTRNERFRSEGLTFDEAAPRLLKEVDRLEPCCSTSSKKAHP